MYHKTIKSDKATKKIILHIGFPKGASTSLQHNLFLRHPSIFPILYRKRKKNLKKWEYFFDEIMTKCDSNIFKSYKKKFLNLVLKVPKKTIVISNEDIIRRVSSSSFTKIFPKSSILVLIREPVSYYESVYAGWLKGVGGKYKSIIDPDSYIRNFIKSTNEYEKLYKIICNLKKWKINILPFELLVENKDIFCQVLGSILNINHIEIKKYFFTTIKNKRISKHSMLAKKIEVFSPFLHQLLFNQKLYGLRLWLKKIIPDKRNEINLRTETIQHIKKKTNYYCQEIDKCCNFSLKKLGYY